MTDADRQEFAMLMTGIAENFGAQLSKPGMVLRFDALRGFSIEQVRAACNSVIRTRKYRQMPTTAEFLEHLEGGNVEDLAMMEAAKVLQAIKGVGGYRSVAFDNATTQAVIEYGFGGWVKMCADLDADKEHWFLKDFAKTYGAYSRQGVSLTGHLAGRSEIANGAGIYADKVRLELIGDHVKALAIAQAEDAPTPRLGAVSAREALGCVMRRITAGVADEHDTAA